MQNAAYIVSTESIPAKPDMVSCQNFAVSPHTKNSSTEKVLCGLQQVLTILDSQIQCMNHDQGNMTWLPVAVLHIISQHAPAEEYQDSCGGNLLTGFLQNGAIMSCSWLRSWSMHDHRKNNNTYGYIIIAHGYNNWRSFSVNLSRICGIQRYDVRNA